MAKFAGSAKVGEKGQIVIPKEVRDMFGISSGETLIVFADTDRGIALVPADIVDAATKERLWGKK